MKHLVNYQREVDKGKLTAVTNFESRSSKQSALLRRRVHARRKRQLFKIRYGG